MESVVDQHETRRSFAGPSSILDVSIAGRMPTDGEWAGISIIDVHRPTGRSICGLHTPVACTVERCLQALGPPGELRHQGGVFSHEELDRTLLELLRTGVIEVKPSDDGAAQSGVEYGFRRAER